MPCRPWLSPRREASLFTFEAPLRDDVAALRFMGSAMPRLSMLGSRVGRVDTRAAKPPPKTVDPIYNDPRWRDLLARLIKERGKRCQKCGRTGTRIFGDHVIELKDGGEPFADDNVELLCGSCHTRKTNAVRAARMRG